MIYSIELAKAQAKREGHKGVKSFSDLSNTQITDKINSGELEVYTQEFTFPTVGGKCSVLLLRKVLTNH